MATTVNLRKLLHRKAWESCTSSPVAATNGSFVISDKFDINNGSRAFLVTSASSIYLYEGQEDSWAALPASGITGTFGPGACGEYRALGAMGGVFIQTATGGTVNTLITNRTIIRRLSGQRLRVIAGAGMGYDGTITMNTLSTNAVITVSPASSVAFDATTQFQVYSGSLWFMNSGAGAVGFSVYDVATNTWTAKSVTNLPTTWGTTGQLVSTMSAAKSFATGTSTAGTATTLSNTAKSWGVNMWANYQTRIVSGTGKGQIRGVTSNTANTLTVAPNWTITPDATSVYSIEGNDDVFYLFGNNSGTLYKFVVSTNTWATLTPTASRAGTLATGGTADWIDNAAEWDYETQVPHYSTLMFKQNGRYIYSFRGSVTPNLDVYDIALNTWVSGIVYGSQMESFTTGTSSADINGTILINKEATGRIFRFDVDANRLLPLATNTTQVALGGAVTDGDKMFILPFTDGGTTIMFVYVLRHSGTELVRMLMV